MAADTTNSSFPEVDWDREHKIDSLDELYAFTVRETKSIIDWYTTASRPKKRWAQALRVIAILATALGGILPILAQIFAPAAGPAPIDAAWASVAIALGATALGLDRYFGFSTAWMRFITTELRLRSRLRTFQYEWEKERLSWSGKAPDYNQIQAMVDRCGTFADEVSVIVQEETRRWVDEFQRTLKQLDENLEMRSERKGVKRE